MSNIDRLLEKDKKVDWELFITRYQEYSPAFAYLITASLIPKSWFSKTTGINFSFRFFKRVGDEYYWSTFDYKKLIKLLEKRGNSNSKFYINAIKQAEEYCEQLIEWSLRIKERDFSNISTKKLLLLFEDYWEYLRKAAAFMLIKHCLNQVLERRIKEKLKSDKVFDNLLIPAKQTLIAKGKRELYKLTLQEKINEKTVDKWLQTYDWVETFTWLGRPLQKTEVMKKISKLKNEKSAKENIAIKNIDKIRYIFKDDPTLLAEIEALQYLLYFHTFEIECLFAAHYWSKNLLKEISSRVDISLQEYPYFIYPEIVDALHGKPLNKTKVLKRKNNHYAICLLSGKISVFEGEILHNLLAITISKKESITEFKGRAAFLGKANGQVVIVKNIKDLKKLKKGNILVAAMTTVDFTPYLREVGAIVTDEGGITSHAAIISREMKKPCIVGTKVATQILRNGDLVEVDANNGVVRILS